MQPIYVQPQRTTSGLATASMVCGILGWVIGWCMFAIPCFIAVALGHAALRETKTGERGGHGQAIAGLILGYCGVVPTVAFFMLGGLGAVTS